MATEDGVVEFDPEELVDVPPPLLRSSDSLVEVAKDEKKCCIKGRLGEVLTLGEDVTVIVVVLGDVIFTVVMGTVLPTLGVVGECIPARSGRYPLLLLYSLTSSYKALLVFDCVGGSGNILRPLRTKLGDDGRTWCEPNIVGLVGGEETANNALVGLHPSMGLNLDSGLTLAAPGMEGPCKTVGEDLVEFGYDDEVKCEGEPTLKFKIVGD